MLSFNSIEVVALGMGILGKGKEAIPGREFRQMRVERQHSKPKETKEETKDVSVFGGKSSLSRGQLREGLRKSSPYIPGSAGRMFGRQERVGLEKEVFGKKYGSGITPREYSKGLKELKKEKSKTPTQAERFKIERKIRYLKGLGGIK